LPVEAVIRTLIDETDRYLAALPGPGIGEVRSGIAAVRGAPVRARAPSGNRVVAEFLPVALDALVATHPVLAAAIGGAAPHLEWITYDDYPAEKIGAFREAHAFASVIGAEAPVWSADFDLGLFLIAPHVLYRDRRHQAPELYAPLTGPHGWRFGPDQPLIVKPAHEPVWNDPFTPHLTKVGPLPFLSVFCWPRDNDFAAEVLPATDWGALEALRLDG
jgi:hypothetical protein